MATLQIYRGESELVAVNIDESTVYSCALMGEDKVIANFQLPEAFGFGIGDYILHNGERYSINTAPDEAKQSSRLFEYELTFEGPAYTLYNKLYQDEGASTFTYFGTPNEFLLLMLTNINSLDSGWTIGSAEDLEPDFIDFDGEDCRQALTKIADHFGLEYIIRGKEITLLDDVGITVPGVSLAYGQGNGLYTISREKIDNEKIVTRLYGFGSSENLPVGYRDGVGRLTFEERYVDLNTEIYGIREGVIIFDDIRPSFTSTISGIIIDDVSDAFFVSDDDFTLTSAEYNAAKVGGLVPRIVFKTGDLQGNEFEILHYAGPQDGGIPATFLLRKNVEASGYILPNSTVAPEIGNEYTIVNISQETGTVTSSEAAVKAATEDAIIDMATPKARYSLEIDEKYVRDEDIADVLIIGNRIHVVDTDLGIDRAIRIQTVSYPLVIPERIGITLSDIVSFSIAETLLTGQARLRAIGARIQKQNVQISVNNTINQNNVYNQLNDPTGENIVSWDRFRVGSYPNHYFQAFKFPTGDEEADPYDYMPTFVGTSINKGLQVIGDPTNELNELYGVVGREGIDAEDIIFAAGAEGLGDADILLSPFYVQRDGYLYTKNASLGDLNINDGIIDINNAGAGEGLAYKEAGGLKFKSFADSLDIGWASDATELNAYLLPTAISDRSLHTAVADDELLILDHVTATIKKVKFSAFVGSKWTDGSGTGYGGTITGIVRDSYVTIGQSTLNAGWKLYVKSSYNGNSDFNAQGVMRLEYANGEVAFWVKGRQTVINQGIAITSGGANLTGLSAQWLENISVLTSGNAGSLSVVSNSISNFITATNSYYNIQVPDGIGGYLNAFRARFVTGGQGLSIGFLGAADVARQEVTGSRGGNAALASLITAMANFGLITDSTT
ncbi:phage tail protein [Peijinzhouia sedimentorum]